MNVGSVPVIGVPAPGPTTPTPGSARVGPGVAATGSELNRLAALGVHGGAAGEAAALQEGGGQAARRADGGRRDAGGRRRPGRRGQAEAGDGQAARARGQDRRARRPVVARQGALAAHGRAEPPAHELALHAEAPPRGHQAVLAPLHRPLRGGELRGGGAVAGHQLAIARAESLEQVEPGPRAVEVAAGEQLEQRARLRGDIDRGEAPPQAVERGALVRPRLVEPRPSGRQGPLGAGQSAAERGVPGVEGVALGAQLVGGGGGARQRGAGERRQDQGGEASGGAGQGARAHPLLIGRGGPALDRCAA